mmetsp:Transcript_87690/g.221289  ORF Transcript_87690/g.221289 Transcript_87690/m.221289 type:complete len:310 (+) Transcript_87690:2028-2957(+)
MHEHPGLHELACRDLLCEDLRNLNKMSVLQGIYDVIPLLWEAVVDLSATCHEAICVMLSGVHSVRWKRVRHHSRIDLVVRIAVCQRVVAAAAILGLHQQETCQDLLLVEVRLTLRGRETSHRGCHPARRTESQVCRRVCLEAERRERQQILLCWRRGRRLRSGRWHSGRQRRGRSRGRSRGLRFHLNDQLLPLALMVPTSLHDACGVWCVGVDLRLGPGLQEDLVAGPDGTCLSLLPDGQLLPLASVTPLCVHGRAIQVPRLWVVTYRYAPACPSVEQDHVPGLDVTATRRLLNDEMLPRAGIVPLRVH